MLTRLFWDILIFMNLQLFKLFKILCLGVFCFFLASCANKPNVNTSPAQRNAEAAINDAVALYELGVISIEQERWLDAKDELDAAINALVVIGTHPQIHDTLIQYRDLLLSDILDAFEDVYPSIALLEEQEEEFVFPEFEEEIILDSTDAKFTQDSIDFSLFDIPVVINDRVKKEIKYLTERVPSFTRGALNRQSIYKPVITKILSEAGMPQDLIYLSMVESGYKIKAYSRARASGLWQFIPGTGRRYGLKIDWWLDMRRNPEKSTRASMKYLRDLYEEFGDWYLAMAAYNCGEGRVRRLIKKYNTRDYWQLPLPKETYHYVPRILAAMVIGKYPQHYGIEVEPEKPWEYETVELKHCMSIDVAAKAAGVSEKEIKKLNPELKRWCTPPNMKVYTLRVPKGTKEKFKKSYAAMDKSKLVRWGRHKVQWGENLGMIARKYGVSVASIKSANNIRGSRIWAKQVLVIPIRPDFKESGSKTASRKKSKSNETASPKDYFIYKVRRGDNLGFIAEKFRVPFSKLLKWNGLSKRSIIRVGQKLRIYGASTSSPAIGNASTHTVKRGENYYLIAQKYGLTINELKKLNKTTSSRIYPGQKLIVSKKAKKKTLKSTSLEKKSTGSPLTYKVKKGDNLYDIARKHKVTISDLKRWNGSASSRIYPGQTLKLYASSGDNSSNTNLLYVVQRGDNLWDIAKKYNVSLKQLYIWNNLDNGIIKPGMKLIVSK